MAPVLTPRECCAFLRVCIVLSINQVSTSLEVSQPTSQQASSLNVAPEERLWILRLSTRHALRLTCKELAEAGPGGYGLCVEARVSTRVKAQDEVTMTTV